MGVTQREPLHKSAEYQAKLEQALDYATQQLSRKEVKVTPAEIRAAIEAAYLKAQAPAVK
ncbi:phage holin, LLH family [Paenibacillus sp. IHB B 3415]|uniref:phage holin, LLH family n=1 Tax=Paenibacillus sp. IHB B 3415 TaxID=867080 RepID=UPI00128D3A3F|nr:phage holin, LLH family [Paenibacillus sp. IHB B 3415]